MRLVVDMNLSTAWVSALTGVGVEAVHWSCVGPPEAPDRAIMDWAQADGSVILTRDLDFAAALTRQGLHSPSIIQIRANRVHLDHHLPRLREAMERYAVHLARGAVVTIEDNRTRVRVLD